MDRLSDKTALITGASSGIGTAIAEVFADAGADIISMSLGGGGFSEAMDEAITPEWV